MTSETSCADIISTWEIQSQFEVRLEQLFLGPFIFILLPYVRKREKHKRFSTKDSKLSMKKTNSNITREIAPEKETNIVAFRIVGRLSTHKRAVCNPVFSEVKHLDLSGYNTASQKPHEPYVVHFSSVLSFPCSISNLTLVSQLELSLYCVDLGFFFGHIALNLFGSNGILRQGRCLIPFNVYPSLELVTPSLGCGEVLPDDHCTECNHSFGSHTTTSDDLLFHPPFNIFDESDENEDASILSSASSISSVSSSSPLNSNTEMGCDNTLHHKTASQSILRMFYDSFFRRGRSHIRKPSKKSNRSHDYPKVQNPLKPRTSKKKLSSVSVACPAWSSSSSLSSSSSILPQFMFNEKTANSGAVNSAADEVSTVEFNYQSNHVNHEKEDQPSKPERSALKKKLQKAKSLDECEKNQIAELHNNHQQQSHRHDHCGYQHFDEHNSMKSNKGDYTSKSTLSQGDKAYKSLDCLSHGAKTHYRMSCRRHFVEYCSDNEDCILVSGPTKKPFYDMLSSSTSSLSSSSLRTSSSFSASSFEKNDESKIVKKHYPTVISVSKKKYTRVKNHIGHCETKYKTLNFPCKSSVIYQRRYLYRAHHAPKSSQVKIPTRLKQSLDRACAEGRGSNDRALLKSTMRGEYNSHLLSKQAKRNLCAKMEKRRFNYKKAVASELLGGHQKKVKLSEDFIILCDELSASKRKAFLSKERRSSIKCSFDQSSNCQSKLTAVSNSCGNQNNKSTNNRSRLRHGSTKQQSLGSHTLESNPTTSDQIATNHQSQRHQKHRLSMRGKKAFSTALDPPHSFSQSLSFVLSGKRAPRVPSSLSSSSSSSFCSSSSSSSSGRAKLNSNKLFNSSSNYGGWVHVRSVGSLRRSTYRAINCYKLLDLYNRGALPLCSSSEANEQSRSRMQEMCEKYLKISLERFGFLSLCLPAFRAPVLYALQPHSLSNSHLYAMNQEPQQRSYSRSSTCGVIPPHFGLDSYDFGFQNTSGSRRSAMYSGRQQDLALNSNLLYKQQDQLGSTRETVTSTFSSCPYHYAQDMGGFMSASLLAEKSFSSFSKRVSSEKEHNENQPYRSSWRLPSNDPLEAFLGSTSAQISKQEAFEQFLQAFSKDTVGWEWKFQLLQLIQRLHEQLSLSNSTTAGPANPQLKPPHAQQSEISASHYDSLKLFEHASNSNKAEPATQGGKVKPVSTQDDQSTLSTAPITLGDDDLNQSADSNKDLFLSRFSALDPELSFVSTSQVASTESTEIVKNRTRMLTVKKNSQSVHKARQECLDLNHKITYTNSKSTLTGGGTTSQITNEGSTAQITTVRSLSDTACNQMKRSADDWEFGDRGLNSAMDDNSVVYSEDKKENQFFRKTSAQLRRCYSAADVLQSNMAHSATRKMHMAIFRAERGNFSAKELLAGTDSSYRNRNESGEVEAEKANTALEKKFVSGEVSTAIFDGLRAPTALPENSTSNFAFLPSYFFSAQLLSAKALTSVLPKINTPFSSSGLQSEMKEIPPLTSAVCETSGSKVESVRISSMEMNVLLKALWSHLGVHPHLHDAFGVTLLQYFTNYYQQQIMNSVEFPSEAPLTQAEMSSTAYHPNKRSMQGFRTDQAARAMCLQHGMALSDQMVVQQHFETFVQKQGMSSSTSTKSVTCAAHVEGGNLPEAFELPPAKCKKSATGSSSFFTQFGAAHKQMKEDSQSSKKTDEVEEPVSPHYHRSVYDEAQLSLAIVSRPVTLTLSNQSKCILWRNRNLLKQRGVGLLKLVSAAEYALVPSKISAGLFELLSSWPCMTIETTLELLSPLSTNPYARQFAVNALGSVSDLQLCRFLPQLVQAIRYDTAGPQSRLLDFLIERAASSPLIASKLHWGLLCESEDPEGGHLFIRGHQRLMDKLSNSYASILSARGWQVIELQKKLIRYLRFLSSQVRERRDRAEHKTLRFRTLLTNLSSSSNVHTSNKNAEHGTHFTQRKASAAQPPGSLMMYSVHPAISSSSEEFNVLDLETPIPLPIEPHYLLIGVIPEESFVVRSSQYPLLLTCRVLTLKKSCPKCSRIQAVASQEQFVYSQLNRSSASVPSDGFQMPQDSCSGNYHAQQNTKRYAKGNMCSSCLGGITYSSHDTVSLSEYQELMSYWGRPTEELLQSGKFVESVQKYLFKSGDDLRQDQLVTQFISIMNDLLISYGCDFCLTVYHVCPFSRQDGLIEFIDNSASLSTIKKAYPTLRHYFSSFSPVPNTALGFSSRVLDRFIRSCSAFSVITFLLGVGDRHLENLMISTNGCLFHVDFGFILGEDPKPFPPPMKLCSEIVDALGGIGSQGYTEFQLRCCQCYRCLRQHSNLLLDILLLMSSSGIRGLKADPLAVIARVQEKFQLNTTETEAEAYLLDIVGVSANALFPAVVDKFHEWTIYWK